MMRPVMPDLFRLQGLPPKVKFGVRFSAPEGCAASAIRAALMVDSYISHIGGFCSYASKQYQEQTASLQTALSPEYLGRATI
jgi:hypothetical protein